MKSQTLFTNYASIPIIYSHPAREKFILPPRCELRVKLPVNLLEGDAVLEFKEFTEGVRMPTALVSCSNGFASTVIQNCTDLEQTLLVTSPFYVEPYNENKYRKNTKDLLGLDEQTLELIHLTEDRLNQILPYKRNPSKYNLFDLLTYEIIKASKVNDT
ncbi:unnamed protein product [Leptidea sinapis]|uniref:Uncharacterized protein n=1 Tax=Leptidea sinapis TaxID=189913 RepID=A0A5E4QL84_9NEOP|nr:unnamed protein product [Leptidea sinapis]